MRYARGQSLIEYASVIGLVAVVAIGGLSLFGENLQGLLSMMQNTWTGNSSSTNITQGEVSSIAIPSLEVTGVNGSTEGTEASGNLRYTMANGETLDIPYPTDLAERVDASGVNGATHAYATYLEALADTMLEAGEISSDEAAWLRKMSDGAFLIASKQKLLDDLIKNPQTNYLEMYTQIPLNNPAGTPSSSLSLYSLAEELAHLDALPFMNFEDFERAVTSPGDFKTVLEFGMIGSYVEAKDQGFFTNPQLDALLKDAMLQVGISRYATKDFLKQAESGIEVSASNNPITEQFNQARDNAGSICTASHENAVTGLSCQPKG
jgi:Flp pilus assembly pilin Flp